MKHFFKALWLWFALPLALSAQVDTVITGRLNAADFTQSWASDWLQEKKQYQPDSLIIIKIREILSRNQVHCRISLGTWCSDSRQHVPALLKIAECTGLNCELWGISREKECPWPDCTSWSIEYVPTFEIIAGQREIGRLVETPKLSVEADLLVILEKITN